MLVRLRREFIAIVMALVGLVLVAALGFAFASSWATQRALTGAALTRALEGDLTSIRFGDDTQGGSGAVLAVTLDVTLDGRVSDVNSTAYQIGDQDIIGEIVREVLSSSSSEGESADHPVSWKRAEVTVNGALAGYRVALVDTASRDAALRAQAANDVVIFAVAMGVLFAATQLLARWALRPVEEAWERQRRFVSDASHELKTPLAVILANTQILESEQGLPERAERWVRSTSEEANHMRGLVEDLLTLARADEQQATGAPGPAAGGDVDLSELVSGCALEFDAVAFERGCSIECDLARDVHVTGDRDQLGRLVRTLLDNATKYAERGTVVRVGLAREGHRARLTVNNRGEVIAPEDLEHLFDRFYRTDRARERTGAGGFGLGLAIAKSIAEAHGGKISAASTKADGTTFTVTI